jgi:hypothetical protein
VTAALVTLALAILAAAGTAVGLAIALGGEQKKNGALELAAGRAADARDQAQADLDRVRTGAATDAGRYEALVADMKRRLAAAEEALLANDSPGAVRDHLRGLLASVNDPAHARTLDAVDVLPLRAAAAPAATPAAGPRGTG